MHYKASYLLTVARQEKLLVGDTPGHALVLTEVEGEPIEFRPGVAGDFVSRRSVSIHDRYKNRGSISGYVHATFQHGAVYSRFEGKRDGNVVTGQWEVYEGNGKLTNLKGKGTFSTKPSEKRGSFIMEMEGEYELPQA